MKKIKKFFKSLGPGLITGASDDDPAGIATYSQTGAQFGYGQLWTSLFSFPFMTVIQEICGRVGLTTGMGLAGVIKRNYDKKILYFAVSLLFMANVINIGADLGAMASSVQLIVDLPFSLLLILISIVTLFLIIQVSYRQYERFLKFLTLSLIAYVITAFVVKQDFSEIVVSTLIPNFSLNKAYLLNLVAILGTTISPYLFFWQADEEVEEEIADNKLTDMGIGSPHISKKDIRKMRVDTISGMFISNLIMFFIIATVASTLGANNIRNIETADQAASALKPFAGDFAFLLFALGIVGTGLLAIPVLAGSASYALSEAFGWKAGLNKKFSKAKTFYLLIGAAMFIGLCVNLLPIKPFQMLYYSAIINGIAAPILLILIMFISNNKKIMGEYKNSIISNTLGWCITAVMAAASIALLLTFIGVIK